MPLTGSGFINVVTVTGRAPPNCSGTFGKTSAAIEVTHKVRYVTKKADRNTVSPLSLRPVAIFFQHFSTAPRRKLAPGRVYWGHKAAVDGLVVAGVLPDYSGQFASRVAFLPVVRARWTALDLQLVEPGS